MTKELPIDPNNMAKAYDPVQFEEPLYDWWESKGYFKPEYAGDKAELLRDSAGMEPEAILQTMMREAPA